MRSIDVRAPESLHARVEALVAERSARRRRGATSAVAAARVRARLGRGSAAAGALAAVVIAALVVGLRGRRLELLADAARRPPR